MTLLDERERLGEAIDELKQALRIELEPLPRLALKIILFFLAVSRRGARGG